MLNTERSCTWAWCVLRITPFVWEKLWMDDRWMSVGEIAAHLGVSKDTIYTWVSSRRMPGHRVGRFWKFKKGEVDEWVRAGGAATVTTSEPDERDAR